MPKKVDAAYDLLVDISHQVRTVLTREGISDDVSIKAGQAVLAYVVDYWGGQMLYIPKHVRFKTQQRDGELFAKFTGHNVAELAREFGISLQQTYKIIRQQRAWRQTASPVAGRKIG